MSESEEFLRAFAMNLAAGSPTARPASDPVNPSQPLDLASVWGAVSADRDSESECLADLLSAVAKSATSGLTEPQAGPLPPSDLVSAVATSGLAEPPLGPLPPSPAGASLSGCLGPGGPPSPPSIVPSLDFSQGIPSDGADDGAAERRWWDQVRETEQQRSDEEIIPANVVDFASAFRTALQSQYRLPERNPLRHPWEEGVFGEIFGMSGSELLPSLKRATVTVLDGDGEVSGCAVPSSTKRSRVLDKGVSFASVVKVRVPVSWSEQREAQFEIAIDLWLSLTKDWGRCKFIELLDSEPPGDAQRAVVTDVFRGKAPSTLLKRGSSSCTLASFLGGEVCYLSVPGRGSVFLLEEDGERRSAKKPVHRPSGGLGFRASRHWSRGGRVSHHEQKVPWDWCGRGVQRGKAGSTTYCQATSEAT